MVASENRDIPLPEPRNHRWIKARIPATVGTLQATSVTFASGASYLITINGTTNSKVSATGATLNSGASVNIASGSNDSFVYGVSNVSLALTLNNGSLGVAGSNDTITFSGTNATVSITGNNDALTMSVVSRIKCRIARSGRANAR